MKKTQDATLKLEQQKLLGFRILAEEQKSDTNHGRKIDPKIGGKAGTKIGVKPGSKPT